MSNATICVGHKIKEIRVSKGLSQKFVAGKLEIHSSTLNKYEGGSRKVNADMLPEIAEVLGVAVGTFFEEEIDVTSNAVWRDASHVQQG